MRAFTFVAALLPALALCETFSNKRNSKESVSTKGGIENENENYVIDYRAWQLSFRDADAVDVDS